MKERSLSDAIIVKPILHKMVGYVKVHRNSVIEGKKPLKCKICDVGYTK